MNTDKEAHSSQEKEIQELIAAFDAALNNKDVETLLKDYNDEIVLFDIGSQQKGKDAYKELWTRCFPYFEDKIGSERKDLTIYVSNDLAFMHCFNRLSGMKSTDPVTKSWVRVTVCYRKIAGRWQVVHEHASFPVDCEAGKVSFVLDEAVYG